MRLAYLLLLFLALGAGSYHRSSSSSVGLTPPDSAGGGLILQAAEGERRVRRPPPSTVAALGSPFIIKVDRHNGGSSDFFMGYEDIPPGRAIARHYHPHVDEILFVHRGSGVAMLGAREAAVSEGSTIYIPPNTRVSVKNTGTTPLTIVFLFPQSELGDYFRDGSVAEGQQAVPFTPEEFAAMRARHREHITFEP
jgi:mannose-6-phosphate isomerase-like protein (cupin superfamily)